MYVIEFFGHSAAKGETVFAGNTKADMLSFLDYESETLINRYMQDRAAQAKQFCSQVPIKSVTIVWPLEREESGAYYAISTVSGKRSREFKDQ